MLFVLASDPLATWGQAAAIVLAIYMFVFLLIGVALSLALMYAFAWVREKTELLKKLRPTVDSVNTTLDLAGTETLPATVDGNNKLVQAVQAVKSAQVVQKARDVQGQLNNVEQKVVRGADRVAGVAIEFRARTVMVQGMLKAFFLPGLTRQTTPPLLQARLDSNRPANTAITAESPGSAGESSNVVVAQHVGDGRLEPLANERAEQSDNGSVG
jgi:hypothetical protein